MKLKIISSVLLVTALLSGCSSPPPPTPVEWDKASQSTNSTMPDWQPNNLIIPSSTVTGHWHRAMYGFTGDAGSYDTDVFYAVAHSKRVIVSTYRSASYFASKAWLRRNGAKGVIEFHQRSGFGHQTDIYFYR